MNKKLINLIALLMAAVITLSIPLTAGATTYSGGYGSINYIAHVNLWTNRVRSDLSTSSNANLRVYTTVRYGYYVNGEIFPASTEKTKTATANSANYVEYDKPYSYYVSIADFPSNGIFCDCYYTDTINLHAVIQDAYEQN